MSEFLPEAEPVAIKIIRRNRVRHMEEGDRELNQMAPDLGS